MAISPMEQAAGAAAGYAAGQSYVAPKFTPTHMTPAAAQQSLAMNGFDPTKPYQATGVPGVYVQGGNNFTNGTVLSDAGFTAPANVLNPDGVAGVNTGANTGAKIPAPVAAPAPAPAPAPATSVGTMPTQDQIAGVMQRIWKPTVGAANPWGNLPAGPTTPHLSANSSSSLDPNLGELGTTLGLGVADPATLVGNPYMQHYANLLGNVFGNAFSSVGQAAKTALGTKI